METFKPIAIQKQYIKEVSKGVAQSIYESFFKPLFAILEDNSVNNAKNAVIEALRAGKIYYENGAFRSAKNFSNAVVLELERIGAKYKYGAFYISRSVLPLEIENTIALLAARDMATLAALDTALVQLAGKLTKDTLTQLFIEKTVEKMFKSLQYDLEQSTKERTVPVIDIGVKNPELAISDDVFDKIDDFHETQYTKQGKGKKNKKGKGKNKDGNGDSFGSSSGSSDGGNDSGGTSDTNGNNPPESGTGEGNENPPESTGNTETSTNKPPQVNLDNFELDERSKKVAKDYTYNMNYWVKNWKAKEIVKMRRTVLDMTQKGTRHETIKKYLMKRWKIAERKAAFLARNESNIASSVIKAVHYNQTLGCKYFMWLKSISKEKRELHLEYAKESGNQYGIGGTNIFAFDNPPVIEQIKTENGTYLPKPNGQRGLPNQTYNCECNFVGVKDIDYYINQEKKKNAKRKIFTKITNAIGQCFQRNHTTWRYRRFGKGETL